MNDARYAVEKLGGVYRDLIPIRLSLLEEERYLVRIDKYLQLLKYPRRAGLPAKRPLMGGNRS